MKYLTLALVALILVPSTGMARARDKATCPVDKKQFEVTDKTVKISVNNKDPMQFCSDGCVKTFAKDPEKFVDTKVVGNCPMMGKKTAKIEKGRRFVVNNNLWYVCCGDCTKAFPGRAVDIVGTTIDPVSKKSFKIESSSPKSEVGKQIYYFESDEDKKAFDKEQAKFVITFG